jgi:hypothetical protein
MRRKAAAGSAGTSDSGVLHQLVHLLRKAQLGQLVEKWRGIYQEPPFLLNIEPSILCYGGRLLFREST